MASGPEQPPLLPDYDLLRRIGAGAFGDVWLSQDAEGQYVAIKVIGGHP